MRGSVRNGDGAAIAGVKVACRSFSESREFTATTDETGSFKFPALPPEFYQVWLAGSGTFERPRYAVQVRVVPGGVAQADLGGPGWTTVRGVFPNNPPGIEGARITLRSPPLSDKMGMSVFTAECGSDRRFVLGEVPPGSYFWHIVRVRQEPSELSGFGVVEVPRTSEFRWDISLPRNLLSGSVISNETGQPVSAAQVTLLPTRAGSGFLPVAVVPNSQGRFLMRGIPTGEFRISGDAKGYCPFEATVKVDENTLEEAYEVRLHSCLELQALVVDSEGRPLEALGEIVALKDGKRYRSSGFFSHGDGRFSIAFLPPGRYDLRLDVFGFRPATLRDVDAERERDRVLEFRLLK